MKRLVLLVEGEGDVAAVPCLVGEMLSQLPESLQGQLFLDNAPMKIGGIHQITGRRQGDLQRHLGNANKRSKLGAVLLVLDGDTDRVESKPFCVAENARIIAQRASVAGAGTIFSFAAVFLRQEFESLLISVANQLPGLKQDAVLPSEPEEAPKDAKGWLHNNLADGYNSTQQQVELTRAIQDWGPVASMRSFPRLEHALTELANALEGDRHCSTPASSQD